MDLWGVAVRLAVDPAALPDGLLGVCYDLDHMCYGDRDRLLAQLTAETFPLPAVIQTRAANMDAQLEQLRHHHVAVYEHLEPALRMLAHNHVYHAHA